MSSIPAKRLSCIKPSATLAVAETARRLRASGKEILNLSVGEPDFATPSHIKEAAIVAIQNNQSRYTDVAGTLALRQAIQARINQDIHELYEPDQILVTSGAKQAIYNALQALINPGDEVIIPSPYWVSYPEMVSLAEGVSVVAKTESADRFVLKPDTLATYINPKTKAIILNSPSNPTGQCYHPHELKALADVLLQHPHVWILSDDIYAANTWAKTHQHILQVCPELKNRTLIIHGASKAYAMTGWRIGYAAGPKVLIQAMSTIQSQSTSNACSIAQAAAIAAFQGPQHCVDEMTAAYRERAAYFQAALNKITGVECLPAEGAFYLFPNIEGCRTQLELKDDVAFSHYLLEHAQIAVVPGSAFGCPGHVRMSIATTHSVLEQVTGQLEWLFGIKARNA